MGLQDPTGDRHHSGLTEPAAAFFEKQGARMQGVAHNSFVFQDPSDSAKVIKLSLAPQDGWLLWAKWAIVRRLRGDGASKHLPHVEATHQVGGVLIARMERLRPLPIIHPFRRAMREHKRSPLDLAQHNALLGASAGRLLIEAHLTFPDAHWDLGPSNWMQRPGDGTLILNDPISHMRHSGNP